MEDENNSFIRTYKSKATEEHINTTDFDDIISNYNSSILLSRLKEAFKKKKVKTVNIITNTSNVNCKRHRKVDPIGTKLSEHKTSFFDHIGIYPRPKKSPSGSLMLVPKSERTRVELDSSARSAYTHKHSKHGSPDSSTLSKENMEKYKNFLNTDHKVFYLKQHHKNKMEKLYAIQPVLTIDGNMYGVPIKPSFDSKQNVSTSSSLSPSYQCISTKKKNKSERFQSKDIKEKNRIRRKPKDVKGLGDSPLQIYTTNSHLHHTKVTSCEKSPSRLPGFTSSEIWNFLLQKGKKSKNSDSECQCGQVRVPCTTKNCPHTHTTAYPDASPESLSSFTSPNYPNTFPQPTVPIPPSTPPNHTNSHCRCPPVYTKKDTEKQSGYHQKSPSNGPCQISHDILATVLREQFSKEILCIHNPQCMIINGCLNVTTQHEPKQAEVPRQNVKKTGVYNVMRCKKKQLDTYNKASQCHPPYLEVMQYSHQMRKDIKNNLREQNTQSLCYHDPPCAIVPVCYDYPYHNEDTACDHIPICPLVPNCALKPNNDGHYWQNDSLYMNYSTDINNASTQVKPRTKRLCQHEPPCAMIAKCLSKIRNGDNYMPPEMMPQCPHRPRCDLVPACYSQDSGKAEPAMMSVKSPKRSLFYQTKILGKANNKLK